MQIHEKPALGRTPTTGDKLVLDTGSATYNIDYNALVSAIVGTAFKSETISVSETSQAANSIRSETKSLTIPSGYAYFCSVIEKAANNCAISVQKRTNENSIRITFVNPSGVSLTTGGDIVVWYKKT